MREKNTKRLRQYIRSRGWPIAAEPYTQFVNGIVIASEGRQKYQEAKKVIRKGGR